MPALRCRGEGIRELVRGFAAPACCSQRADHMKIDLLGPADAERADYILNHPSVASGWGGARIDVPALLSTPGVIALMGEHGGQFYHRRGPGLYEGHSAFLPKGRGRYALVATHATLKWMFTRTDAVEVITR